VRACVRVKHIDEFLSCTC